MSGVEISARGLASADSRFRERALARRRRPWRRVLWTVLAVLVVSAGVWLTFWSPVFAVRSIQVAGVTGADRTAVASLVGVDRGTPLALVDLDDVEERVRSRRTIAEVSVERGWPGTLRVSVVARQPALVLKNPQGQLEVVDATGVSYDTVASPPAGIPVVSAASTKGTTKEALEAALSVIQTLPTDLTQRVTAIQVSTANLVSFNLAGIRVVWGGADQAERKLEILRALLPTKPGTIDVSAPDTPVTR
ncbi:MULTISPECIES: cell division protein FtsQ/DivIB [unclassified Knoellia]|uniref:cell division protein FtsQ/DivIB n=1 Tax=Knoellia altitudinis TaxID=3404795 RepID=UPI00361FD83C